mmetsp:Transcript_24188/g.26868  ORF Transcript_24188/g.26868 Transcript_24188/m.26868 type:complete len:233 (-) Transcript_24188:195-893(-)
MSLETPIDSVIEQLSITLDSETFAGSMCLLRKLALGQIHPREYQVASTQLLEAYPRQITLVNWLLFALQTQALKAHMHAPQVMHALLSQHAPTVDSKSSRSIMHSYTPHTTIVGRSKQKDDPPSPRLHVTLKRKTKSRERREWTSEEHQRLLDGLREHGNDFEALTQVVRTRTKPQIRTHYRYLAKSSRRKVRGRPPRGRPSAGPTLLQCYITEEIKKLEARKTKPNKTNTM